ncbi:hypothetical protein [Streptomyces sp. NPDC051572]|uniref:response regulator transcription factor n=1 Tax=unclassified Streptomyces TaxID=2593676 RepID=UPI00344DE9F3
MTTVLIVNDQALQRLGLRMFLETQPDLTIVGEATAYAQAVRLADTLRPDVVQHEVSALTTVEDFQVLEECGEQLQSGSPPSAVEEFDLVPQSFVAAIRGDPAEFLNVHVDEFAGISPVRATALFPSLARGSAPAGSESSTSTRPRNRWRSASGEWSPYSAVEQAIGSTLT